MKSKKKKMFLKIVFIGLILTGDRIASSDVTPMRTTGPCGPAGDPAVESHGWHFT